MSKNLLLFTFIIIPFFSFAEIKAGNRVKTDIKKFRKQSWSQKEGLFENSNNYFKKNNLQEKEQKNAIYLNLLPVFLNSYNLFYERRLNAKISATVGLNYYYSKRWYFKYHDSRWYSTTVDFKRYLSGSTLDGLFIAPYIKFRYIIDYDVVGYLEKTPNTRMETIVQNEHWYYFGLGLTSGYQKIFNNGIILGAFAGGGYYPIENLKASNPLYSVSKDLRAEIRAGITVGYSF